MELNNPPCKKLKGKHTKYRNPKTLNLKPQDPQRHFLTARFVNSQQ
jgi:hypothetical protein